MVRAALVAVDCGPRLAARIVADEAADRANWFVARDGPLGSVDRVVGDGHLVAAGDLAVYDAAVDVCRCYLLIDPADVLLDGAHLLRVGFDADGAEHRQGAVSDIGQASHGEVPSM